MRRFLLAHGADANYREEGGLTVLGRAAHKGHVPVVEALLDAGAGELDAPLRYAAVTGHTAIASLLLDRGADVNHGNNQALYNAASAGQLQMAALLLERGATAISESLTVAEERGHHAVADLLRAHGAV